eukprot:TRINITY_DN23051_c0_g1_i4.p2 TRINITY_DN23051_c0_g1~~TRINITY_DN23051_c0_g1_i4.p2  ORF type:complete len:168 (+),score=32.28 TRINITY_DN23051_c0_g1_i4:189-692(+)
MAAALGCARVWRFCWPDKGLKYEFIADLSGADRTVSAECQVQGLLYQLRGSLHGEWPDLRLEYTLASGPNELEVDMIAISPESFAGQWRQKKRAPQACVLICERTGGQWNLYEQGQMAIWRDQEVRVLQVHYHSVPEYFYEVLKPDGGVADVAEDSLRPQPKAASVF